ncbi:MAG: M48 family metallopeptidase [Gracilibacteraceae bacterium]|jgi:predicted metal-dependent hydrolase|nr:M48 family metallopeptidase [Gracilibacteraceae bacterium]
MIAYTLIRSKRRTLALHVRGGQVEARAPLHMPKAEIDRFVQAKEKWLTDKLAESKGLARKREAFSLGYGDSILCRGREYPLAAETGDKSGFDGERFYIPPGLTPAEIKMCCVQIYRIIARRVLTPKTAEFAARMGVRPAAVKISGAKTRWGSCSSRGSVNYSWRLIMADDDMVDYVVVHELAHLVEMNHSGRFWNIVENVLPDFRRRKARLKELQQRLAGGLF